MKPYAAVLAGFAFALGAFGCNQNSEISTPIGENKAAQEEVAATRPAEPARGFVRGVHLVPGLGPISLRSGSQTFASAVTFGNAAPYEGIKEVAAGGTEGIKLGIEAVGSDGKKIVGPMPVTLEQGEELTVFATGVPGDVALLPYKPKTRGIEKGQAKVAFIHAGKALPTAAVRIDGKSFRRAIKYRVATGYVVLPPGRHVVEVEYDKSLPPTVTTIDQPAIITQDELGNVLDVTQPPPTTTVTPRKALVSLKQDIDLMADKVYQVVFFQGVNRQPTLRLLEDRMTQDLARAKPAEH